MWCHKFDVKDYIYHCEINHNSNIKGYNKYDVIKYKDDATYMIVQEIIIPTLKVMIDMML